MVDIEHAGVDWNAAPADRPLRGPGLPQIHSWMAQALGLRDGLKGAHCIHEAWMRGDFSATLAPAMEKLWAVAAESIPEWLPMQFVEWLPLVYEIAGRFSARRRGRTNIYLVLLDYRDAGPGWRDGGSNTPDTTGLGIYVGMSRYPPAQRFDQHKAGIRSAGVVLKRGLEILAGPVRHLQGIARKDAAQIEIALGEVLRDAGLFVKGGH